MFFPLPRPLMGDPKLCGCGSVPHWAYKTWVGTKRIALGVSEFSPTGFLFDPHPLRKMPFLDMRFVV